MVYFFLFFLSWMLFWLFNIIFLFSSYFLLLLESITKWFLSRIYFSVYRAYLAHDSSKSSHESDDWYEKNIIHQNKRKRTEIEMVCMRLSRFSKKWLPFGAVVYDFIRCVFVVLDFLLFFFFPVHSLLELKNESSYSTARGNISSQTVWCIE